MKLHSIIDVCVDCIMVLANGVENEEQETAAGALEVNWPSDHFNLSPGCSESCCGDGDQEWFSYSSCEGCGSPLGGSRMHASVFNN